MLTEEKGVQAIIALQKRGGIAEREEDARRNWRAFTHYEKHNTERAHQILCGGFEKKE